MIVVDVTRKKGSHGHGRVVLINPRVLHQDGPRVVREGRLSVPDYTGNVRRFEQTVVGGTAPDGRVVIRTTSGFDAQAYRHELHHLQRALFLDLLYPLSTDRSGSR